MHIKLVFFFQLVWGYKQKANYLDYFEADLKRAKKGDSEKLWKCLMFASALYRFYSVNVLIISLDQRLCSLSLKTGAPGPAWVQVLLPLFIGCDLQQFTPDICKMRLMVVSHSGLL